MSNLPKGDKLNELYQLKNVVIGIILRQYEPFTKGEILTQVDKWCEGSVYATDGLKRKEVDISKIIDETISILFSYTYIGWSDCEKQKYKLCMSWPAI